jgi:polar amino acid transport system substrate-binding protein
VGERSGHHESTQALGRLVRHAELVDADVPDAAFDLLRTRRTEALASHVPALLAYSVQLAGSRLLDDPYGANRLAMAIAGGQAGRLAYITAFVEEAKASGLVQRAIDEAGQRGIRVAPPGP